MRLVALAFLCLGVVSGTAVFAGTPAHDVKCTARELKPTDAWIVPCKSSARLDLFHSPSLAYEPSRMFTDVFLDFNITDHDSFTMYTGPNCSSVVEQHAEDLRLFGFFKNVQLFSSYQLNPFAETFVGIDTLESYRVAVKIVECNYVRVAMFVGGLVLFIFAHSLVRNALFYYTSGCSIGLLASVLLVAIMVYRMTPKKAIGLPILLGGWSMTGYIMYHGYQNFASVMLNYKEYVAAYFAIWIVISLAYCYRRGPPTDVRSHNLMQWALQAVACALIYFSSQVPELSAAVIVVLLLRSIVFRALFFPLRALGFVKRRWFPARRRLLTQEEYEAQMRETTERELKNLREYCKSPDANWMKITRNVRDPKKLSRFAEGIEDHYTEEEAQVHEMAADMLDRSERDDQWLDDEGTDEYGGWESELRRRRPASSASYRRPGLQESMYSRVMERNAATTSRLPARSRLPPTATRTKSDGHRRLSTMSSASVRSPRRAVEYMEEEELVRQLEVVRREKAAASQGRRKREDQMTSFMDSDDEEDREEVDELMPNQRVIDYEEEDY